MIDDKFKIEATAAPYLPSSPHLKHVVKSAVLEDAPNRTVSSAPVFAFPRGALKTTYP